MIYSMQEKTFSDLTALVWEAETAQAFLPLRGDEPPVLYNLLKRFEGHQDCHFFALLKEPSQEVGFIVTLPYKREGTLGVGPLYIREQYRGMGLGKRLVQELIRWARARGVKGLFAQTWGENVSSRRIFESLGFQFVGETPDTRINGDSTVQYLLQMDRQ
jgi:L-amino acid N-acyltransferase YncA